MEKLIGVMENRQLLQMYLKDGEPVSEETKDAVKAVLAARGYGDTEIERYRESGLAEEDIPMSLAEQEKAEQEDFSGLGGWLGFWLFGVLALFIVNIAWGIRQLDIHLFPALPGLFLIPITGVMFILFLREHRWFPKILVILLALLLIDRLIELIPGAFEADRETMGYFRERLAGIVGTIFMIFYFGFSKHVRQYFGR
jgi:hypothetical protein